MRPVRQSCWSATSVIRKFACCRRHDDVTAKYKHHRSSSFRDAVDHRQAKIPDLIFVSGGSNVVARRGVSRDH
jgi:predicted ester cyclase